MIVAGFCAACAVLTLWLLPSGGRDEGARQGEEVPRPVTGTYRAIAATPAFWIMLSGTLLVNLPFALAHAQIKLLALDKGLSDASAALVVSAFALASIAGRIVSGFAIDTFPAHLVAAFGFFLPACGLLLLVTGGTGAVTVTCAVALVGLAFGAEADVIPYLVRHYFPLAVYSTRSGRLLP